MLLQLRKDNKQEVLQKVSHRENSLIKLALVSNNKH